MKKPTIYVGLIERIGNNLFQIATVASFAQKHGCSYIAIPYSYRLSEPDDYSLYNYLEQFKNTLFKSISIENNYSGKYSLYLEPDCYYEAIPYQKNLFLWGYFQSERYFDKPLVRNLFRIHPNIYNLLQKKYGTLLKEGVISINVRRGDYLNKQDYHPVCTLNYFNNAIDLIGQDKPFLVTNNDLPWCKKNFVGKKSFCRPHDPGRESLSSDVEYKQYYQ